MHRCQQVQNPDCHLTFLLPTNLCKGCFSLFKIYFRLSQCSFSAVGHNTPGVARSSQSQVCFFIIEGTQRVGLGRAHGGRVRGERERVSPLYLPYHRAWQRPQRPTPPHRGPQGRKAAPRCSSERQGLSLWLHSNARGQQIAKAYSAKRPALLVTCGRAVSSTGCGSLSPQNLCGIDVDVERLI